MPYIKQKDSETYLLDLVTGTIEELQTHRALVHYGDYYEIVDEPPTGDYSTNFIPPDLD